MGKEQKNREESEGKKGYLKLWRSDSHNQFLDSTQLGKSQSMW